jgi:NADPH:quinone reductase-like Zn-dependent oxidoreductase
VGASGEEDHMASMQAVRMHEYGGPEVLRHEDAPRPDPAPGEVLVRVHGAGINPVDWKVRAGMFREFIPHALPLVPGWDVSGTVEWPGPNVGRFEHGDEVYTRLDVRRDGAYAEYVAVPSQDLARKPRTIDHLHAAAVPLAALTAWQALFEPAHAELARGQTLLVHGAAGGVGHFAVQLGKWRGARVIATGSTGNEGFLRELGADVFIDYTRSRFEELAGEVDVVLDTLGGDTQHRSWNLLRAGGALVATVEPPSADEAQRRGVRASLVSTQTNVRHLNELTALIDASTVRPVVSRILPLGQARKAHELMEAGHLRGKLVLDVIG